MYMYTHTHTRDIQSPVGGDGPVVFQQGWSFTEHGKKAEGKLVTNPYDLEAWSVLVREAQVCMFPVLLYSKNEALNEAALNGHNFSSVGPIT